MPYHTDTNEEQQQLTLRIPSANQLAAQQMMSAKCEDIAVTIDDEKMPLINKTIDPVITIDTVSL